MKELIVVGISDFKIAKAPDILATYALGSCVGTALLDNFSGIGGLSHIMLPDSKMVSSKDAVNRMKFADTAIDYMVEKMIQKGAAAENLKAKIVGGANMFGANGNNIFGNIGERNIIGVRDALKKLNIPIIKEDIFGNYGRTVFFDLGTGAVTVKSIGRDIIEL